MTNYLIASWGIQGEDWEWVDQTEKIARWYTAGSSVCEEKYSPRLPDYVGAGAGNMGHRGQDRTGRRQHLLESSLEAHQHLLEPVRRRPAMPIDFDVLQRHLHSRSSPARSTSSASWTRRASSSSPAATPNVRVGHDRRHRSLELYTQQFRHPA